MRATRGRGRGLRRIFWIAAACVALGWTAKHALATGEGRSPSLVGPSVPPQARPPLGVLGPSDVERYRQIFSAQRTGRHAQADRLIGQLNDGILVGHVLAERYLHPKNYRSSFEELSGWLERHAELPQAYRIRRLAQGKAPKGARLPDTGPISNSLLGAGQELKEEAFSDGFARPWGQGIAAWRAGDYAAAADRFQALASGAGRPAEETAAAAFWAARSNLRARRPQAVASLLRKAARASDGFYGLLAQRLLDETIRFDWRREELRAEMAGLLLRHTAAKRAIALGQVGESDLAEAEVRKLAGGTVSSQDTQALIALAAALELPSAQMRLAQQLRLIDGRRHDGAMFPIPRWRPQTGFRLDRTLVYAIVRAESAFEIEAESPRGALGLMQVMPDTGAMVAKGAKLAYNGPDDLLMPDLNLEIGQTWLRRLMRTDTIGGNLVHLIIAYNAGESRLKDWLARELKPVRHDPLLFIESVPAAESRSYVKKVLGNLWAYQARLGQPTPSLQALAENRWPEIGGLDVVAAAPAGRQAAPARAAGKAPPAARARVAVTAVPAAPAAAPPRSKPAKAAAVVAKPAKRPAAEPKPQVAAAGGSLGKIVIRARAN